MEYVNDGYVITNKISEQNLREMRSNMDETDQEAFDKFVEENWGTYSDSITKNITHSDSVYVGAEESTVSVSAKPLPKKRGRKPKNPVKDA